MANDQIGTARLLGAIVAFELVAALTGSAGLAQESATVGVAIEADGPAYRVSKFDIAYLRQAHGQPPLHQVLQIKVALGQISGGFVAPRPDSPTITHRIEDLNALAPPQIYYASAIQRLLETIRDDLVSRGFQGIYVAPDPLQIDGQGTDLRPPGDLTLTILMTTGIVTQVRTLAQGDRIDPEERINHSLHERIRLNSPVGPHDQGDATVTQLIRKDLLDDYVLMLSRHPGRHVDIAMSPSAQVGGVTLDYMITETKPWLAYAQLSNTGTRNTSRLREQFGYYNYQLTDHDDVLSIDYVTSDFDDAHWISTAYEARLADSDRIRWHVYGGWSEYTASDVGINRDTFSGESFNIGVDLRVNFLQRGPLFADVGGGIRYERIDVSDSLPGSTPGGNEFLLPYVEVRAQRVTDWASLRGLATVEWQNAGINEVTSGGLDDLGRVDVDKGWAILRWELTQSVFLEPWLDRESWEDPTTPESSTLAHELFLQVRGQHTFGRRVIPQHEMVAGGLYTVRGHRESIVAGDTAIVGTAEYRYHIPRALALEPEPRQAFGKDFRFAPQQVYGPVDWDLIVRGFFDAGYILDESGVGIPEESRTLLGTGVGFEAQYKRNVTFRLDWGVALNSISGLVDSGSNRVHFVLVLLY